MHLCDGALRYDTVYRGSVVVALVQISEARRWLTDTKEEGDFNALDLWAT